MKREADPEVIQVVNMVRLCQTINCLPQPGGLLDQDAYFIFLMLAVMQADDEKAELDKAKNRIPG